MSTALKTIGREGKGDLMWCIIVMLPTQMVPKFTIPVMIRCVLKIAMINRDMKS